MSRSMMIVSAPMEHRMSGQMGQPAAWMIDSKSSSAGVVGRRDAARLWALGSTLRSIDRRSMRRGGLKSTATVDNNVGNPVE
jgi:hypothetical protein